VRKKRHDDDDDEEEEEEISPSFQKLLWSLFGVFFLRNLIMGGVVLIDRHHHFFPFVETCHNNFIFSRGGFRVALQISAFALPPMR